MSPEGTHKLQEDMAQMTMVPTPAVLVSLSQPVLIYSWGDHWYQLTDEEEIWAKMVLSNIQYHLKEDCYSIKALFWDRAKGQWHREILPVGSGYFCLQGKMARFVTIYHLWAVANGLQNGQ